jgi:hypothetical protein
MTFVLVAGLHPVRNKVEMVARAPVNRRSLDSRFMVFWPGSKRCAVVERRHSWAKTERA